MKKYFILTMITLVAMFSMVGCGAKDDDYSEKSDKTKYSKTVTDPVNDKSENEQKLNVKKHDSDINTDILEPIDDNTSEKPSDDISDDISDDTDSSKPSVPEKSKTNTVDVSESEYKTIYITYSKCLNRHLETLTYDELANLIKIEMVSLTYNVWATGEQPSDETIDELFSEINMLEDVSERRGDTYCVKPEWRDIIICCSTSGNFNMVYACFKDLLASEFDIAYYAEQYPEDIAFCEKYEVDPMTYYAYYGVFTGQSMSADFDLETYKTNRPELVDAFGDCNINYYIYYLENIETEKDLANPNK